MKAKCYVLKSLILYMLYVFSTYFVSINNVSNLLISLHYDMICYVYNFFFELNQKKNGLYNCLGVNYYGKISNTDFCTINYDAILTMEDPMKIGI